MRRETVVPQRSFVALAATAAAKHTVGMSPQAQDVSSRRGDATSGRPGDAVCAAATVAIAFYLCALVVAIAANSQSGSSALLRTIKSRLFAPVLVPAWLDLGFDYPLAYGVPEDADHGLRVAGRDAAGAPLRYPGARWGERAARWRRLARTIAVGGADGDGSAVAAGVGRGAFAATGADDVTVRVFREPQPERTAPAAAGSPEQVYAARVRMAGGEVQLIKEEPRGELAPLVPPPAGAGQSP